MEAPTVASNYSTPAGGPSVNAATGQPHLPHLHHQAPPHQPAYGAPGGQHAGSAEDPAANPNAGVAGVAGVPPHHQPGVPYYPHLYGAPQMAAVAPYFVTGQNYYAYSSGDYDVHQQAAAAHQQQQQQHQQYPAVWHQARRHSLDANDNVAQTGPAGYPQAYGVAPGPGGQASPYSRRPGADRAVEQRLPPLPAVTGQTSARGGSTPRQGARAGASSPGNNAAKEDDNYSSESKSPRSPMSPKNRAAHKKFQCPMCKKYFRRDLPRHMRTHQAVARFVCPYPRDDCTHKRGQFNRPYDFKKHLLHAHFWFDNAKMVRGFRDLKSKLDYPGACSCGVRFIARDWLNLHILGGNLCPILANAGMRKEIPKHFMS